MADDKEDIEEVGCHPKDLGEERVASKRRVVVSNRDPDEEMNRDEKDHGGKGDHKVKSQLEEDQEVGQGHAELGEPARAKNEAWVECQVEVPGHRPVDPPPPLLYQRLQALLLLKVKRRARLDSRVEARKPPCTRVLKSVGLVVIRRSHTWFTEEEGGGLGGPSGGRRM